MGIKPSDLSKKQWGLIEGAPEEIAGSATGLGELAMHDEFISWLRKSGLGYYHANPTRHSTIAVGMPDFGLYDESRIMWIEFKTGGNDLSTAQKAKLAQMRERKNVVFVCRDLDKAKELVRKFFHLPI